MQLGMKYTFHVYNYLRNEMVFVLIICDDLKLFN